RIEGRKSSRRNNSRRAGLARQIPRRSSRQPEKYEPAREARYPTTSATSSAPVTSPGATQTARVENRAHSIDSVRARFSRPARAASACSPARGGGAPTRTLRLGAGASRASRGPQCRGPRDRDFNPTGSDFQLERFAFADAESAARYGFDE